MTRRPPDTQLARLDDAVLAVEAPDAGQALAAWHVEMDGGMVALGDAAQLHPVVARELAMRILAVLGASERESDHAEYARIAEQLDRQFRDARPAHGKTTGTPSERVAGMLVVEADDVAVLRLSTFTIAPLRRRKSGWEGAVVEARPAGKLGHYFRELGFSVHLDDAVVQASRPKPRALLEGPRPPRRPPEPPTTPVLAATLADRRAEAAELNARILATVGAVGARAAWEALASTLRLPRELLRERLDVLTDAGHLHHHKAKGEEPEAWERLARAELRSEWIAILRAVGPIGARASWRRIFGRLRLSPEALVAHLDALVAAGHLRSHGGSGEGDAPEAWERLPGSDLRPPAARKGGTRLVRGRRAPRPKGAPKKTRKSDTAAKPMVASSPPVLVVVSCWKCNRASRVPANIAGTDECRCRVCHGRME